MEHRESTKAEYERVWTAVNAYIENNFAQDISIDDFCKSVHASRRSVQRILTSYGSGWRQLLRRRRLNVASHRLLHTDMSVKQISASVGYRQQAQFAKAFKGQFGLSPVRYRATFNASTLGKTS